MLLASLLESTCNAISSWFLASGQAKRESVCVFVCTVEKAGNTQNEVQSLILPVLGLCDAKTRGISMQIQQCPGCHHLPISCIWFWWALKGCVSRWGGMSGGCSVCACFCLVLVAGTMLECQNKKHCCHSVARGTDSGPGDPTILQILVQQPQKCRISPVGRDSQGPWKSNSYLIHEFSRSNHGCLKYIVWNFLVPVPFCSPTAN